MEKYIEEINKIWNEPNNYFRFYENELKMNWRGFGSITLCITETPKGEKCIGYKSTMPNGSWPALKKIINFLCEAENTKIIMRLP